MLVDWHLDLSELCRPELIRSVVFDKSLRNVSKPLTLLAASVLE